MTTPLQKAAQSAIDILESGDPLSCEREAANNLQKALDAEIAQAVEPYTTCLSNCETCEYSAINPVTDGSVHCYMFRKEPIGVCASWMPIEVATPQPQATAQKLTIDESRAAFEKYWLETRGAKKANRALQRHHKQPQTYCENSANRHWTTWQAAQGEKP